MFTWFLNRIFQTKNDCGWKNLSNWSSSICCLCCPTIEFFGNSTGIKELMVDDLLANVGIGIVSLLCLSFLAKEVPDPAACGTDPRSLCGAQRGFLGENQTWKNEYQKRFTVIPMYSMCQEAGDCRGSAWNKNLESLQVDWKRKTISHCDLIPLLEILPSHS